jgi:transposase
MDDVMVAVGIDISKDDFHVCLKEKTASEAVKIKGTRSFSNDSKGFDDLVLWVLKREKQGTRVCYIMEATGTYYENLAYYLHGKGKKVSVVLPNKINHFAKSLNVKTKTDKVDSDFIAQIGIERELPVWKPMSANYKHLRDLCREMLSLKKERSRAKCQLHAMEYSHEKTPSVLQIKETLIDFYEKLILQIETEITKIIKTDKELKKRIERIMKVKGLGLITIVVVLCETNGFELFNSIRQVVSFAGLDVKMNESGKFKGKTKISKKGNARIRQCLFMPAMCATNWNDKIKDLYDRIAERNPGVKRKGIIAAMRKLLIIIFVLWKNGEEYNPQHMWQ